jgi:hypothetical protein
MGQTTEPPQNAAECDGALGGTACRAYVPLWAHTSLNGARERSRADPTFSIP